MENINRIPVLVIRFGNPISVNELQYFRGAIISKVPAEYTLFHNHIDDGFRYRYPLIQYKRIGGNAAIVCIGEGTDAIGQFFANADFDLQIGNRNATFKVDKVEPSRVLIQPWEQSFKYTCRKWLPLNKENYEQYKNLDGVAERALFLQKILVGNILSMCTGLGIHIEKNIDCSVTNISETSIYRYKGVLMTGFDVEFKTNISLPDYIGLGKGVSLGYGMIKQQKINSNK